MKKNICKSCPVSQRLQFTQPPHAFKATDHRSLAWLYLWRMALGSSVPDTPKAFGRFVQSVRRQTCGVPAAKFHRMYCKIWSETKNKTLLFTLENFSFERSCTYIPYFFCFIHFLLESNVLSYHCQQNPPPFEAVLTLLSARPKAAAPSVAHGLRPLVVAFFGGEEKKCPKNTGRRWNSAGRSEISGSLEVSM